jgi:hypothetical protein
MTSSPLSRRDRIGAVERRGWRGIVQKVLDRSTVYEHWAYARARLRCLLAGE